MPSWLTALQRGLELHAVSHSVVAELILAAQEEEVIASDVSSLTKGKQLLTRPQMRHG